MTRGFWRMLMEVHDRDAEMYRKRAPILGAQELKCSLYRDGIEDV